MKDVISKYTTMALNNLILIPFAAFLQFDSKMVVSIPLSCEQQGMQTCWCSDYSYEHSEEDYRTFCSETDECAPENVLRNCDSDVQGIFLNTY